MQILEKPDLAEKEGSGEVPGPRVDEEGALLIPPLRVNPPSPRRLFTAAAGPLAFWRAPSGAMLCTSASAAESMAPESRERPPRPSTCPMAM